MWHSETMGSSDQHREVVGAVSCFLGGIWIAAEGLTGSSALVGLALIFYFFWAKPSLKLVLFWGVMGLLGFQRYLWATPVMDETDLAYYRSETESFAFEGVVVDYPDVRSDRIKLTVKPDQLDGLVLITLDRYPEYSYGTRLRVRGMLQVPAVFEDFSYEAYLRRYGVDSVMYQPWVEVIGDEGGFFLWRGLYFMKSRVEERLNLLFTEPHASFVAGLLLGSRRGIPPAVMEEFNATGLTHIIAISGYNITLIILFISSLFQFLSKRAQIIIASCTIIVFVGFVGATAAVARASIMGLLGLWAIWFGRISEVTRLLAFTAGGMCAWNPFILVDDVGFHLSFAATCGLVYTTSWVESVLKAVRLYDKIPSLFSIREALVTTLAAQTFATPVLIVHFERLSLIAPIANVLVVSLIPLAMLTSFLALLVSYLWFGGGVAVAYLAWFFLQSILFIAHFLSHLPFASLNL